LCEESSIVKGYRISPDVLAEMVRIRLLRREPRVGDNYYELTHDTLIAPVLASRHKRDRRRRFLMLRVLPVAIVLSVGVGAAIWFETWIRDNRDLLEREDSAEVRAAIATPAGNTISLGTATENRTGQLRWLGFSWPGRVILDTWDVNVSEKTDLSFELRSSSFDPYLVVQNPDGSTTGDDDSGGGFDAEVVIPDAQEGLYRVFVTSYGGSETGDYRLGVSRERAKVERGDLASEQVLAELPIKGELPAGGNITGVLTQDDMFRGVISHKWTVALTEPQARDVILESSAFDAYLIVRTPGGVIPDDDGHSGTDSQVSLPAGVYGDFQIVVTSYSGEETGQYTLSVIPTPAAR
jgi:hypothetical protein